MSSTEHIRNLLKQKLSALTVDVEDQSDRHKSHAGAMKGGGHYSVVVVSDAFKGKSLIERHRQVYDALSELSSEIHALAIKTYTVEELEKLK